MTRWVRTGVLTLLCALIAAVAGAGRAEASSAQISIIQDDPQMLANPAATLLRFRELGAQQVRIAIRWEAIAPDPNSFVAPRRFDAANPAAYSNTSWLPYDAMVRDAVADGIQVNFNVVGGAPVWATGPGMPELSVARGFPFHNWDPNAADFGQFMRALGTRYSGDYDPRTKRLEPGNAADLPRVSFWSIWNEPDYGPSLAPQALPGHPGVPDSPRLYRLLVDQAWTALNATGHGNDSVLIGELAPRATEQQFGDFNGMLPIVFVQSLYCVGLNYKPLRGTAASLQGCPTTSAGTARFAAQNPLLFSALGFSDHPYMRSFPPDVEEDNPPVKGFSSLVRGFTTLATIGNLQAALTGVLSAYHRQRTFPIWNTEFGYITSPPKRVWKNDSTKYSSPTLAALYDNWAEYLSWRNPDIASFEQYLLYDPEPARQSNDYGGFASGLLYNGGRQKPGYAAWRLPIFLPKMDASGPNDPLEVWGDVRPVDYAELDMPDVPETAQLLFEPGRRGPYELLDTVDVTAPYGYFEKPVRFPASGILVMRWSYPTDDLGFGPAAGATVYSRPVQVTVK